MNNGQTLQGRPRFIPSGSHGQCLLALYWLTCVIDPRRPEPDQGPGVNGVPNRYDGFTDRPKNNTWTRLRIVSPLSR